MARENQWGHRGAEWRDLTWAVGAAALVTVLLAVAVAVVWFIGRAPSQAPAVAVSASLPTTPTPRALVFARNTPQAEGAAEDVAAAESAAPSGEPAATATPELLAISAAEASATAASGPILEASRDEDFSALASGSWGVRDEQLFNEGSSPVAEPWLRLASVPGTSLAIEAEIRVESLLETVCDQSFGLAVGDPDAGAVYGAGLLFPCGDASPQARLSDITIWEDGYNADPSIAEEPFDPAEAWHAYRLELRGDRVRLIVDGDGVVSGTLPAPLDPEASGMEAGIWSQGAAVTVRKVTISALPPG